PPTRDARLGALGPGPAEFSAAGGRPASIRESVLRGGVSACFPGRAPAGRGTPRPARRRSGARPFEEGGSLVPGGPLSGFAAERRMRTRAGRVCIPLSAGREAGRGRGSRGRGVRRRGPV